MNKKLIISVVLALVIIGGGFALFHMSMSPKTPASNNTSATNSSSKVNNAVLVTKTSSSLGSYLAEPNGDPLYTYNGDSSGASTVTGSLLASWPAYQDKGSTTSLPSGVGTIKRTDNGQTQYTYNGMPLYTFVADSNGQPTGNGASNFAIATPAAASSTQQTTTPSTQSTNSSYSNQYP